MTRHVVAYEGTLQPDFAFSWGRAAVVEDGQWFCAPHGGARAPLALAKMYVLDGRLTELPEPFDVSGIALDAPMVLAVRSGGVVPADVLCPVVRAGTLALFQVHRDTSFYLYPTGACLATVRRQIAERLAYWLRARTHVLDATQRYEIAGWAVWLDGTNPIALATRVWLSGADGGRAVGLARERLALLLRDPCEQQRLTTAFETELCILVSGALTPLAAPG